MANEVIASDEFGLEDKYGDIFANGYSSKELMFTRHIKTPPSMDDNVSSLFKMFGGATYKPTEMYFEILTQDDKRYEATFDSVMLGNGTAARKTQVWKKHYVTSGDCPMYYMRVAQMYLIKAEAMARTNASIKDCLDVLNVLRSPVTRLLRRPITVPVRRAGRGVPGECTGNRDGKRGYILSRRKIYRKRSSEVERHEPELRA
ncbi:MAG: hypothetical protein ACLU4N_27130 [Butyricimonas faecihominis]